MQRKVGFLRESTAIARFFQDIGNQEVTTIKSKEVATLFLTVKFVETKYYEGKKMKVFAF